MASFFSRFHPAGTTAITKQDIKVKTVKVPAAGSAPHPLPIISHSRPSTPRTTSSSAAAASGHGSSSKTKSISKTATINTTITTTNAGLLSPPSSSRADGRGRDHKALKGRERSSSRDITRDRSLKRKESSSSFQRLDSPSTTTSSLRSVSPSNDSVTSHTQSKKRRLTPSAPHHRNSPIQERLVSSDDDSDSGSEDGTMIGGSMTKVERLREAKELGLMTRNYLNPKSFKSERMSFVHADQIANTKKEGYRRVFRADSKILEVSLSYPAMPLNERYMLVQHRDSDEFNPIGDITATIEMVATQLLSPKHRIPITTEDPEAGGVLLKIRRSLRKSDPKLLEEAIEKYNKLIRTYRKTGVFQRNIEKLGKNGTGIPLAFSEHILTQSYARSVALEVDSLRKYEAFSNNVYGELLPRFTSKLFKEAKLRPDQVFVDLGSGTGNVVLHAALEVGCESWGCEMMEKACELADAQAREFEARCILWGVKPGKVTLEKGDFLENQAIAGVLGRADVLLVNNYAFDSNLNARLIDMFLDLKEGTQIISLKSFVPPNHAITPRNVDSPVNLLRVEEKEYFSGCVSWTNAPGRYYVATVDRSMLRAFMKEEH